MKKEEIKKNIEKLKKYGKSNFYRASLRYTKFYEDKNLKNQILIQSYDGSSISGNPYYILLQLNKNEKYKKIPKFIVVNKKTKEMIDKKLKDLKISNFKTVIIHSKEYCKVLAHSKYLINNSTFPVYFMKKEGQVYLNTWHGTPLKAMGRDIVDSPHELGNVQRNFMMADFLIYQNDFMFEKMKDAYMLDNIYNGKYVLSGYPRNDIFLKKDNQKQIRKDLDLSNKKVIVYMPTWRGTAAKKDNRKQTKLILETLKELEEKMGDNYVLYLKIHNLACVNINYNLYSKIRPFPDNYETYEFLSVADCLITDYSSVMFDFANTGKKIILYTYDYQEYTKNRGFYLDVKTLPFPMVYNQKQLCNEILDLNSNVNYAEFQHKYCKYDSKFTSREICRLLFEKENANLKIIDGKSLNNGKENILIFTGALLKNGITSSLKGLINNIDLNKYNYYLTFYRNAVAKNCYVINSFNKKCNYIPIQGLKDYRLLELISILLYYKCNWDNKFIRKYIKKVYEREIKRVYVNIKFKAAIDFCGYDKQPINMISYMDTLKIRYTHSDMKKEQESRNNFHVPSLKHAYKTYDKIAIVREGMDKEIRTHFKGICPQNIELAHNVNDVNNIISNSRKKIDFSAMTYSNYTIEQINEIINNKENIVFITIGRFSIEKSHSRLLNAFKKIQRKNKNAYLIIIGGHGNQFSNTMKQIKNEQIKNVIVIKNMENPYPILKKCDLFILSSLYEGLPMTIMESLILKVPILSVDIPGPRPFLSQGYAYLVKNSEDGLYKGMKKFINGDFPKLKKFDSTQFNNQAISEFYKLIEK